MAADVQETHRSGPLKQKNKPHKHGKHKSKGQIEKETKGRVNVKVLSKKALKVKRKDDKRQQMVLKRKQKREEVLTKKRSIGAAGSPPHCVAVIKLHSSTSIQTVIDTLKHCDDTLTWTVSKSGIVHFSVPRFKQRVEFCITEYGNLYEILDAVKVADSVLFLVDVNEGVDNFGEYCLSCILGQGIPSVTLVTQGLNDVPQKRQKDVRKNLQKIMEKWFPDDKINSLDNSQEGLLVIRQIVSQKLKTVHFRERRPYLLAENVEFDETKPGVSGTLKVTGYLRNCTVSVNRLVHLPGWGNFQMSQIDVLEDPNPLNLKTNRYKSGEDTEMRSVEPTSIEKPDPTKQESLESEVTPDPMEGEQTWPTEEELNEAMEQKKMARRVPKGTSEYQASWIVEDDNDDVHNDETDESEDEIEGMEADEVMSDDGGEMHTGSEPSEGEEEEEYETITSKEDDEDARYDKTIDMEEEMTLLSKLKEEKKHVMFPDEIDTPLDVTARTRFQKYRGLKSFRTSPWDPKENLPLDYARIFQFDNFKRTEKRVMEQMEDLVEGGVTMWSYITVHIADVPKAFIDEHKTGRPVVVFGLLPHEQKMSVVNVVLRKTFEYSKPVKSKDRLVFHMGFRRFSACPIFSQHTNGKKHKFERFLRQDTVTVATMFCPIMFPPAPVLVFKEGAFGRLDLIAKGSLLSVDPDRIIAKRAVLSGYPLKINKKSCVVRYMFFNREDINWFKPVELRTKWGRRGHIKDPIGTHGHMKCTFDGHLKSQDTVMMNLYKRVFPKWTYNPHVSPPPSGGTLKHARMETVMEDVEEGDAYALFD